MRPERTIVLLKQFLGDGVMTEPLISTLAENYRQVDVLALPSVQQVLGHLNGTVSFIEAKKLKTLRDTMVEARRLRQARYDIAFLVNRSFRAAMLARLAKIPVRVGHGTEGRSFLLTKSVTYHAEDFEAKSYVDLAEAAGIRAPRVEPLLKVDREEAAEGERLVQKATIAIQPGARHDYKRTRTEHLAAVGNEMQRSGHKLILVGGTEEQPAGDALKAALKEPVIDLIGKCSIRQTLAALSHMRAAVGSDTGVMHLAAALGIPTVTAFGPTPAIKWGHHYAPHQVIQAPNQDLAQLDPTVLVQAALRAIGEA